LKYPEHSRLRYFPGCVSKSGSSRVLQNNRVKREKSMRFAHTHATGKLWWNAMHGRWSLRRAAGESRWQLSLHMLRWLQLFPRQDQWLRALGAQDMTQQAATSDPRLYERWHHSYISTHFDLDTRRNIVRAHYAFLMQRFRAPLCASIVQGHSVRLASLWLEDASRVHLHLGKPARAQAGELQLSLLTQDRHVLASCIFTFDRHDSLLIGAVRGASLHTPFAASSAFIRSSHGLQPSHLLVSLVQAMAGTLRLERIRAVGSTACITNSTHGVANQGNRAFWQEQGAVPAEAGCHALPLSPVTATCAEDPGNHRGRQLRREAFRRHACETFASAFSKRAAAHPVDPMTREVSEAPVDPRPPAQANPKPASGARNLLAATP
jgi:uncharacterized protein VirK/YbjX